MRDKLKEHAEGCDGTCGDVHDKASALHSITQSFNAIRASKDEFPLTPGGSNVLDWGLRVVTDIRYDEAVPDSDLTINGMATIAYRVCQIAGTVDLITRVAGATGPTRLN